MPIFANPAPERELFFSDEAIGFPSTMADPAVQDFIVTRMGHRLEFDEVFYILEDLLYHERIRYSDYKKQCAAIVAYRDYNFISHDYLFCNYIRNMVSFVWWLEGLHAQYHYAKQYQQEWTDNLPVAYILNDDDMVDEFTAIIRRIDWVFPVDVGRFHACEVHGIAHFPMDSLEIPEAYVLQVIDEYFSEEEVADLVADMENINPEIFN
jgi:hypothetical protein